MNKKRKRILKLYIVDNIICVVSNKYLLYGKVISLFKKVINIIMIGFYVKRIVCLIIWLIW